MTDKPEWVKMKPAEVEKKILELHEQKNTPAKIGLILRDQFSIPKAKVLGKRITQVLKENKKNYTTEKEEVEKKMTVLENHLQKNKRDYSAKRSLTKKRWIVKKLSA